MRVVCLSCFDESTPKDFAAIEKVRLWIERSDGPSNRHFLQIGNRRELLDALSHPTKLRDVDVLILAAHGYSDGDFHMRDGNKAAASDVVGELRKGALPEKAVLFLFACNGAKSTALQSLFPANGRGPRMIFGATRLALSNPMKNAIQDVAAAHDPGKLNVDRAKAIVDERLACRVDGVTQKATPPEEPFLCVIWGPNDRYPPA